MQQNTVEKCEPFSYIQIDFIGPFDNNFRKKYVLVCVDKNTNYCVIRPKESPKAEVVVKLLKKIQNMYNTPTKINCDNESHFNNSKVKDFRDKNKINLVFSSTYSPQSQGSVERMNGIFKKSLKKYSVKTLSLIHI